MLKTLPPCTSGVGVERLAFSSQPELRMSLIDNLEGQHNSGKGQPIEDLPPRSCKGGCCTAQQG